jgi:hypothetical protein
MSNEAEGLRAEGSEESVWIEGEELRAEGNEESV